MREGRNSEDSDIERSGGGDTLKEANPTTVPIREGSRKGKEYDPATDGHGSGSR